MNTWSKMLSGCGSGSALQPMSVFDHVYTEITEELEAQRDGYAAYLDSFEGAHS